MLLVDGADITEIAVGCKLVSPWNNGASTFTFEYPAAKRGAFENGSTVVFTYGGADLFYGFLFESSQTERSVKCTCYDQLRYLKAKDTVMRRVEPLDSFLNRVASQVEERIRLGRIDATEVNLSKYNFDSKTYLDMLYQSIRENLYLNGYHYTLRDNFGAIELRDTLTLRLPLVIGDGSLATGFTYQKSIGDDTYNFIKVAKEDKEKGVRDLYVAKDSVNIAKWGKLTHLEKVTGNLNETQLRQRANVLLGLKNRETEKLKVNCMGDTRVMGGSGVKVRLSAPDIDLWAVVEQAEHSFGQSGHTMTLNLSYGRWY